MIIDRFKDLLGKARGTRNKKLLMLAGGCVLFLIVDIFFIFIPLTGKNFSLKRRIISVKNSIDSLNSDISKMGLADKRLEDLTAERAGYSKRFPKEEEVPALLGEISTIAGKLGIDIIAVKPITANKDVIEEGVLYRQVTVEISAKGGYHQLGQFINKLETYGRLIDVRNAEIIADSAMPRKHRIRLLIATYILTRDMG